MPLVTYFALGGTIASIREPGRSGAAPALTATELLRSIALPDSVEVDVVQFLQVPSPEITITDIIRLHEAIRAAVTNGARGIVVSQGTDTLEESAFLLDLLWEGPEPIVLTGAMRGPSLPGSDGPANLVAAVQVAACELVRGCGVVVVFNDEIHAARFARKTHTSNPAAFCSPTLGPIGWIAEGRPVVATRPVPMQRLPSPKTTLVPPVALITMGLGDEGLLLQAVAKLGYQGLVVEAFGGGHMRAASVPVLAELSATMPVVLASRTGAGQVLRGTYDFPGSEMDLLRRGLVHGGYLDGLKARLLLSLCLANKMSQRQIAQTFGSFSSG